MSDSQVPPQFTSKSIDIQGDWFVFTMFTEEEAIAAYKEAMASGREAKRDGVVLRVLFKSTGRGAIPKKAPQR